MSGGEKNTEKTLKELLKENNFAFTKNYKELRKLGLKLLDTVILNEILSFHMDGKNYTGSAGYICDEFHVSNDTALSSLKRLVDKGYLIKKTSKGGNKKTSIYSINEDKIKPIFLNSGEIPQLKEQTVENLDSKPSKNQIVNRLKIRHNKNNNKNINKNSSSISTTILKNNELEDVCNMYVQEISRQIYCSSIEIESIQKLIIDYGTDKVKEAIKIAVERNKKSLGYIKGVLNNKKAAGNNQPQEVQPPAYKKWQGDEEDEPKPILTEAEKAEREKQIKEAHERLKSLSNIISQN